MSGNRWWAGVAAGVVLGLGGAIVAAAGGEASAAPVAVTPEQLLINQRISQAAVRRSNEALGLLGPVRPANSTDQDPVNPFAGVARGSGWPTAAYANGSVTGAKIANGTVTTQDLAPCPAGTQLIAGVCAETALRQGGQQVSWAAAAAACLAASRRLPLPGESALIGKVLGAAAFGTGNWSGDTGVNGAQQTAAIVLPAGQYVQISQADLVQYRCVTAALGGQ